MKIIQTAGQLFADRGYADMTCKEICEAAQANGTAINYHFGSREGLYMAVLHEMHNYLATPEAVIKLENSDLSPREKLSYIVDRLVATIFAGDSWQTRLWAREIVSPSSLTMELLEDQEVTLVSMMKKILGELTGIPSGKPELSFCYLEVMAPFMILLIIGNRRPSPHRAIYSFDQETVAANMKEILFAGLEAFTIKYWREQDQASAPSTPG